jgi:CBS domain-containing protein
MYCPHCSHLNLPGSDQCGRCLFDLASVDLPVPQDKIDASLMTDPVQVLSPKAPVTISAHASLGEALARMLDRSVGALLVTDRSERLLGILTERDFLEKIAGLPDFERLPAERFMTRDPESVAPTDTLAFAMRKMSVGGYRHMPVVDEGVPVGVFSVRDLLRHVTRLCTPAG